MTNPFKPSRVRRGRRGQVLVLGALSVLIVALALFMTLSISWQVKEKIRVQNAADAQAYSTAVKVARAFNYFAYSNRAMAGAIVSMTMVHAYHSEMAASADLYFWVGLQHFSMAGQEVGKCCSCGILGCCKISHCIHAGIDTITGVKFIGKANKFAKEIKDLEKPFNDAIKGFETMVKMIRGSQMAVQASLAIDLLSPLSLTASDGIHVNIPAGSDSPSALGAFNVAQVMGALDTGESKNKRRDMTEMVNASRPTWVRNRGLLGNQPLLSPLTMRVKNDGGGTWFAAQTPLLGGGGGLYDKDPSTVVTNILQIGKPKANIEGKSIASYDWWSFSGMCKHNCAFGSTMMPFLGLIMPSVIASNSSSGKHSPTFIFSGHQGSHKLDIKALLNFISFKIKTKGRYNQPVIYGSAKQKLGLNEQKQTLPWDITSDGLASAELIGKGTVQIANPKESKSMSKAVVYYHHPGYWREPPNFFNPYWRAKLHPFAASEAAAVAAMLGDTTSAVAGPLMGLTASGDPAMSGL